MSEIEFGVKLLCDSPMLRKFLAVVGCQGMNMASKWLEQANDRIGDGLRLLGLDVGHQGEARAALIERHQRTLLAGSDDEIRLPVTEALLGLDNGGALVNRGLVGDGATPFVAPVALPPGLLTTQGLMEAAAGFLVLVDVLIDALMTDRRLIIRFEVT